MGAMGEEQSHGDSDEWEGNGPGEYVYINHHLAPGASRLPGTLLIPILMKAAPRTLSQSCTKLAAAVSSFRHDRVRFAFVFYSHVACTVLTREVSFSFLRILS